MSLDPDQDRPQEPSGPLPFEMTHPPRIDGHWWVCAATPDQRGRMNPTGGDADFSLLPDGRLSFSVRLLIGYRRREAAGIAAAKADSRGVYRWKGFGFVRLVTWFRWGYRLSRDDALLLIAHPGSPLSDPTALVFARDGVSQSTAAALLPVHAADLGLTPADARALTLFAPPSAVDE